ncbi:hypothetical protein ACI8AF_22875 [Blastococcus sp. SYSU D00669]
MRRLSALLAGAGALALLTGCASAAEPDVGDVATAFEDPAADPQARCDLLAPATLATFESEESASCPEAIGDVPLPGGEVTAVEVWGGDAQVRLGGETVFLTETDAGWKVTAAGCEPQGDAPYECEVEGP